MIIIKKLLVIVISFFVFTTNVSAISASGAVAMDLSSGRVLYNSNMNNKRLIASITKIMTCILAIENGDLDQEVKIGEEVLKAYGSAIYIEMGEKIKLKDLLYGLMLRSGNDAAIEIAYAVAGDMPSFTKLMNEKAKEIGMKDTMFLNAHGLEEDNGQGNISTAYDMALLTKYAYQNQTFKEIFGTKTITVKSDKKTYTWKNKNKILHSYDFITGGKTGYTIKAKRTLVTTAEKDNKQIVIVTLNDGNDFSDHINLYQQLFNEYDAVQVINKELFSLKNCNNCYVENDYYALVTKKEQDALRIENVLEKNSDSKYAGLVRVWLKDDILHEEIIYKGNETQIKKSIWQKIIEWFKSW